MDARPHLGPLQDAIVALAQTVQDVDVRAYESLPADRLAAELRPIVAALLQDAQKLVGDVLRVADADGDAAPADSTVLGSPYAPFEQAVDAVLDTQRTTSLRSAGDISFLAQLELRQRADRLQRLQSSSTAAAIVGECDSALRRIGKALTSMDVALARAGGVEARLNFTSELEVSLRVRKACAKLRERVLGDGTPTAENVHVRMRSAGTAIAMLVGWEVYPSLRVDDRLQLRELQRRVLDWLRGAREYAPGLRIWEDLVGFVRMLADVSRRQELVEHDATVLTALRRHLASPQASEVPDELLELASSLSGLDDGIDRLLESSERASVDAWRVALEALGPRGRAAEVGLP